jgi:hypothetical protein
VVVKAEVESADGRAIKSEVAPALKDSVKDSLSEILVVKDGAPGIERLVGGEEHRALAPVAGR